MKPHVEVAEGRWLPSRYRYALPRLVAFLILRRATAAPFPTPDRREVIILDRDQNSAESFALSIFFDVWIAACLSGAAIRYGGLNVVPAIGLFAIFLVITPVAMQIPMYAVLGASAPPRRAGLPALSWLFRPHPGHAGRCGPPGVVAGRATCPPPAASSSSPPPCTRVSS